MFLRFLLPCRYQAIHVIQQYTCQHHVSISTKISTNSNSHHTFMNSYIYRVSGNRKKQPKWPAIGGRSWGSWSVLWVGVSVGVGMSQNYANAVWLLKYVNVVRSSRTLCTSSASPFSFCTLQHNSRHFSFLICHFSFVAFLSPSLCLLVWCF